MKKRGILDWFRWESKAAQQARMDRYSQMMFPLGPEQKEWEIKTLKELYPKIKDIKELHFDLLTLRETIFYATLPADDEDYQSITEGLAAWEKNNFSRMRKDASAKTLKAMAYLEAAATSLEELPSIEQIKADESLY